MKPSEIANLLRVIADVIESDSSVVKAIEKSLANNLNLPKTKVDSIEVVSKKCKNSSISINGESLLTQCRKILRERGDEELKKYLIELEEQVRDILKHGQLDPNRTVRRRKNLNSIVDYIVLTLKAQDKNGMSFANSSLNKT